MRNLASKLARAIALYAMCHFVLGASLVLAQPTGLHATNVVDYSFVANWAASGASMYYLDLSTDVNFTSYVGQYHNYPVPATSCSVTGLNRNVTYFFRLRTKGIWGIYSPYSEVCAVTTGLPVPSVPVPLPATTVTETAFTANWSPAFWIMNYFPYSTMPATGYRLDVATDSTFDTFVPGYIDHNVGPSMSVPVVGLNPCTKYYYRVRAYNGHGISGSSNSVTVITLTLPSAPVATPATLVTSTGFTTNWAPVPSAVGYRLDISVTSAFTSFVLPYFLCDVGNATSLEVTGLNPTTTYYYRVRAYSATGSLGATSNVVSVMTKSPDAPPSCIISSYYDPNPTERAYVEYGNSLLLKVTATDPDAGDQLTITSSTLPAGVSMDPALGIPGPSPLVSTFSWTPTRTQAGSHVVSFTVTDGEGATAVSSVTIEVLDRLRLTDQGWSDPTVGTWDPTTRTATLTADLVDPGTISRNIYLLASNVTLDGAKHLITATNMFPQIAAVVIPGHVHDVTVKNLRVTNMHIGVRVEGDNCIVSDNKFENLHTAVSVSSAVRPTKVSNLVFRDNTITNCGYDNTGGTPSTYYAIEVDGSDCKFYHNSILRCLPGAVASVIGGVGNQFNLPAPDGGNYWSDYAGTDNNGDGFGDTPYSFPGGQDNLPWLWQGGWRNPFANSALLNGTTSRMRVLDASTPQPGAYAINGTAITVEAWIFPMDFPNASLGNTIIARALNSANVEPSSSYRLWLNHSDGIARPAFSISSGAGGTAVTVTAPDDLPTFQWAHLTGTYDGNALSIYVNGILKAQTTTSITINSSGGVGFYIGRFLTDGFMGAVDEVRLWNITRSQADIQRTMKARLEGNESGLTGYWTMDEVTSTSRMVDQTSNHNDLIVTAPAPMIPFNPSTPSGTPIFGITPSTFNFGTKEQGSLATLNFTISNSGNVPLVGFLEHISPDLPLNSVPLFFVGGGQSVPASVTVRPMVAGQFSGNIMLAANGGANRPIPYSLSSIALRQFDANNISMWTLRDGRFGHDPMNRRSGFEWPKGSGKTVIYESGLWVGAKVNGFVRTAVAGFTSEFQPGPIQSVGGSAADPNDLRYRVYKISAGDNAGSNPDYAEWPADLGAPVNPDGTPTVIGNQTLFAVYNDLDPAKHYHGSAPLGAEVQQTTFGFDQSGARSNTVFLRFKVTNKSNSTWQDTYVSLWGDPDLGTASDDLVAADVSRNMGIVYNGAATDAVYSQPPAVGFDILKGAFFTNPIQGFIPYTAGGIYNDPVNSAQDYNVMAGLAPNGTQFTDPTIPATTSFVYSGDPVTNTGWIDTKPGDRRFLLTTGAFTLEPGQSKELVAAIIVGQGADNLSSITALRAASDEIQTLFDGGQVFGGALEAVVTASAPEGDNSTLSDIGESGAELTFTGGEGGATVEVASYVEAPPGASSVTTTSVGGVGNYLDVQVEGSVEWPVDIRIYYTANDLLQAGLHESDLQGIYYWNATSGQWILYSNSGADDQGRGPSTTGVHMTNVTIDGVEYEGYVEAMAYHLTPVVIGGAKKTMDARYAAAIEFIRSLPDNAFKKPAGTRRSGLIDALTISNAFQREGKLKNAAQKLAESVSNHLTPQGNSTQDLWVTDETARQTLLQMINVILDLLRQAQSVAKAGDQDVVEEAADNVIPTEYALSQNYPNPFNPTTTIQYDLPEETFVSLKVYDILGREVRTLVNSVQKPGVYRVRFHGESLQSGVYLYRLQAGKFAQVMKLTLIR